MRKISTILYYVLLSLLLLIGVLPIYLCAVWDTQMKEGRWLGIKEFSRKWR